MKMFALVAAAALILVGMGTAAVARAESRSECMSDAQERHQNCLEEAATVCDNSNWILCEGHGRQEQISSAKQDCLLKYQQSRNHCNNLQ